MNVHKSLWMEILFDIFDVNFDVRMWLQLFGWRRRISVGVYFISSFFHIIHDWKWKMNQEEFANGWKLRLTVAHVLIRLIINEIFFLGFFFSAKGSILLNYIEENIEMFCWRISGGFVGVRQVETFPLLASSSWEQSRRNVLCVLFRHSWNDRLKRQQSSAVQRWNEEKIRQREAKVFRRRFVIVRFVFSCNGNNINNYSEQKKINISQLSHDHVNV